MKEINVRQAPAAAQRRTSRGRAPKILLLPYGSAGAGQGALKIGVQARQTGKSFMTACESRSRDCIREPGTKWVCLSAGPKGRRSNGCRNAASGPRPIKVGGWATPRSDRAATPNRCMRAAEVRFGYRVADHCRFPRTPARRKELLGPIVILDEFAYHDDPDAILEAAMFPSSYQPARGHSSLSVCEAHAEG